MHVKHFSKRDEAFWRWAMLEQMLSAGGHEVVLAADGKQGMRQHRAEPADLIVTDVFMPEKDGVEIVVELREDSPKLPVIAISGIPGMNMLNLVQELRGANTLKRPFQPDELLAAVESAR